MLFTWDVKEEYLRQLERIGCVVEDTDIGYRSAWMRIRTTTGKMAELMVLPWIVSAEVETERTTYGVAYV
jgi:hypothetical protein